MRKRPNPRPPVVIVRETCVYKLNELLIHWYEKEYRLVGSVQGVYDNYQTNYIATLEAPDEDL